MDFRDRLRELRIEKGLSQEKLGAMLCVSKMCVSHWECGNSEPCIDQLKTLSKTFDVSIDYLVGASD